jgi:hypothetical protein
MGDEKEKSQSNKFKDLAREVGADEDEKAFQRALRKVAGRQAIDVTPGEDGYEPPVTDGKAQAGS